MLSLVAPDSSGDTASRRRGPRETTFPSWTCLRSRAEHADENASPRYFARVPPGFCRYRRQGRYCPPLGLDNQAVGGRSSRASRCRQSQAAVPAPGLAILQLYLYLNADPGPLWGERLLMPSSRLNGASRRDHPAHAPRTPEASATAVIPLRRGGASRPAKRATHRNRWAIAAGNPGCVPSSCRSPGIGPNDPSPFP
jgi:hypothetical protein